MTSPETFGVIYIVSAHCALFRICGFSFIVVLLVGGSATYFGLWKNHIHINLFPLLIII